MARGHWGDAVAFKEIRLIVAAVAVSGGQWVQVHPELVAANAGQFLGGQDQFARQWALVLQKVGNALLGCANAQGEGRLRRGNPYRFYEGEICLARVHTRELPKTGNYYKSFCSGALQIFL
ncbi:hypothetical protein OMP43_03800 [Sphingomonas sp. CBMAI 2297]|uniref:hypothetical protein n=1 Tax=Sphingomonas sp. CBMAI 2297 TaxID=2991720 RepID=UPI00245387B8|nr:hypothetical protein [Sphingomonas sp. CBMAI 2297]MDH4743139.1 hypothetical protein [Sphingomonas sp. CBMAI 2297]